MKPFFEMIVVIPIGPNIKDSFVNDTISSIYYFIHDEIKIILLDDSQQQAGLRLQSVWKDVDVVTTDKNFGRFSGLYISLSKAYLFAHINYDFRLLLKLDTDALIIGHNPHYSALELFASEKCMGLAGQYPNDYFGKPWNIGWPRRRLLNGVSTWKFIRRPLANWAIRKYYIQAIKNNYRPGESVFGGAYFISPAFIEALHAEGLLPCKEFKALNLGEDHIFSLLAKSLGFGLGDLASHDLPMACAWKGLPESPIALADSNKKIIHSTRYWNDLTESEIRSFFRNLRTGTAIPENTISE